MTDVLVEDSRQDQKGETTISFPNDEAFWGFFESTRLGARLARLCALFLQLQTRGLVTVYFVR